MSQEKLLINSFCTKLPWSIASSFFEKHHISKGMGAEKTADKLCKKLDEKELSVNTLADMKKLYSDYITFGDKTIAIDIIDAHQAKSIESGYGSIPIEIPYGSINFPYRDDSTDYLLDEQLKLTKVDRITRFIHFYFISKRMETETIVIDDNYLKSQDVKWQIPKGMFDVSGKLRAERRRIDVVSIDLIDNRIIYKLDAKTQYLTADIEDSVRLLVKKFRQLVLNPLSVSPENHNLFPAIRKMYNNSKGTICELGYQVASVTHLERTRASGKDLRYEAFHEGGKKSVPGLDVFRIATRYKTKRQNFDTSTEILLPGSSRLLSAQGPASLRSAVMGRCLSSEDFVRHLKDLS